MKRLKNLLKLIYRFFLKKIENIKILKVKIKKYLKYLQKNLFYDNINVVMDKSINVAFEDMLKTCNLSEKDRYEVRQIFYMLSPKKQQNIINNFNIMVDRINKFKKDIEEQQKYLLEKAAKKLDDIVLQTEKENIIWETCEYLSSMKDECDEACNYVKNIKNENPNSEKIGKNKKT